MKKMLKENKQITTQNILSKVNKSIEFIK